MLRERACETARNRLAAIESAVKHGSRKRAKLLVRQYLVSDAAKISASYRVLGGEASDGAVLRLSRLIDPFQPCPAPVRWWRFRKGTGGSRQICLLPRRLRAANLIAKDVLQAQYRPGNHVYDTRWRGRDVEARYIQRALEGGRAWCVLGDLTDAFQPVSENALYALPLPQTVIRHTLDRRFLHLQYTPEKEHPDLRQNETTSFSGEAMAGRYGPRGLLQGSPASNLILAWLLNDMPSVLPPDCVPFLLADNVLVAARSEEASREIEHTLIRYFAEHRAGPFVLRSEITSVELGFERAGYGFERPLCTEQVEVVPSDANVLKIYEALHDAIEADFEAERVEPFEGRRALDAKLSGFRAITHWEKFREAELEHMRIELMSNLNHPQGVEEEIVRLLNSLSPNERPGLLRSIERRLSELPVVQSAGDGE